MPRRTPETSGIEPQSNDYFVWSSRLPDNTAVKERTIPAAQFKAHCPALLGEVADGASIVVTRRGKAVARLTRATLPGDPVGMPLILRRRYPPAPAPAPPLTFQYRSTEAGKACRSRNESRGNRADPRSGCGCPALAPPASPPMHPRGRDRDCCAWQSARRSA